MVGDAVGRVAQNKGHSSTAFNKEYNVMEICFIIVINV
jgi:hypothetical protein